MKKLLIIAAIASISVSAQAAEKQLSLQEQIRLDAQRDPYAEAVRSDNVDASGITIVDQYYIEPVAAKQMQPSKVFKTDKHGNIKIKN